MSLWRQLARGLRALGNRKATDRDIAEEVDSYLDEATAARVASGLSAEEARRAARVEMGSATAAREQVRGYGWENRLEVLLADLRYTARTLIANRGFAAVSILTLALGIGASTAIFSVVDAVLLRPLPYPNAQKIVRVWEQAPDGHRMNLADPNFDDFRSQNDTFQTLAVYGFGPSSVAGGSEPVRVNIAEVSRGFFQAMGVEPVRGRDLSSEEHRYHGAPAALVSYGYWQRYLGGTTDLAKVRLRIESNTYPVVGVMPSGFDFPHDVAVWMAREQYPELTSRTAHNWHGLGRVRDGVPVARARANLNAIARRIRAQYGKDVNLSGAAVVTLAEALVGDVRSALLTLLGAVGLLLLIACANVAGLLVARAAARSKEVAVRAALGAGRGRLTQQHLVESFTLSLAGGTLGVLMALGAVRLLPAILPPDLPRQEEISLNAPVLLFALAAVLAVAISLGVFAAWRAATGDLQAALTAGSRSYSGTRANQRLRGLLVAGEIAATLVILLGAGLLGRSFVRLVSTDPGFQPQNLVTMEFALPIPWQLSMDQTAIAHQVHLLDDLMSRLRSLPRVSSVGLAGAVPVADGDDLADGDFLILHGQKAPANFEEWGRMDQNRAEAGHALYCVASAAYFRTLDIPLLRGRLFDERDAANAPHVAVISETLARQRWPHQDAIGQTIDFGNMDGNLKPLTIVGIAGDVRASGLDAPPSPIIYVNYRQRGMNGNSSPTILLRSDAPKGETVSAARHIFHALAPDVPVKFSTFDAEMGGWLAERRFLLLLVALFAGAALTLAAVGIYGVVAFSVSRRTREIGVRVALGAQRMDVLRLVVGEGARLASLGVAVGIAASLATARLLSSLLFGVSATDPLTFVSVAALLALVTLLASYIPARRAARLDPNLALREE